MVSYNDNDNNNYYTFYRTLWS